MIKSYDNYSPPHSYSDYEESLTESIHQSLENDYSYLDFYNESDKELSSEHIKLLSLNHYINHYLTYIVEDELVFFLFQAELFLNLRRYTNSLSACFCFEAFGGSSVVSKCISLVDLYQMNYTKNFKNLKEEITKLKLDNISQTLRKNVVGTIQVSALIPDFVNCINNLKNRKKQ
ncbi:hypothetical protein TpMuguga_02g00308 [Theileria parva strain Muguga]|uniref:uncharacterized protein n=1 Tax=Theileria parva strain Muguga TaxID=333668 RepID=UPI001C619BCB|nr:uncharacterized protein TpMuguga_02g00308 [Theileria parva strain Muguga]EAN32591.2 hypothetical protein TpMuguga_02g00308 [Theileria parva strain Muguga]